ncbi:hypothetical protein PG990_009302 [Apiospora arundinis]|uniref:Uncharacterized protein n=1 Tax=Apiospora arundinis TaxID=335852 RepID=A0ABR2IHV9_9PEZI
MEPNSDAVLSMMLSNEIEFHNTTKYLLSQSNVCCAAWKVASEITSSDLLDTQVRLAESEEKLRLAQAELQQLKAKIGHLPTTNSFTTVARSNLELHEMRDGHGDCMEAADMAGSK